MNLGDAQSCPPQRSSKAKSARNGRGNRHSTLGNLKCDCPAAPTGRSGFIVCRPGAPHRSSRFRSGAWCRRCLCRWRRFRARCRCRSRPCCRSWRRRSRARTCYRSRTHPCHLDREQGLESGLLLPGGREPAADDLAVAEGLADLGLDVLLETPDHQPLVPEVLRREVVRVRDGGGVQHVHQAREAPRPAVVRGRGQRRPLARSLGDSAARNRGCPGHGPG